MSIKRTTDLHPEFKVFRTDIQDSYICITALVTNPDADSVRVAGVIYDQVAEILAESGAQIIHERIFGKIEIHKNILGARNRKIRCLFPEDPGMVTYVEGKSCYGNPLAGVQLRAFRPSREEEKVKTILEGNIPRGRKWSRKGAIFLQFQNLYGESSSEKRNRREQTEEMFHKAETLLTTEGASFRDVARTWIYVDNILDWYKEFNSARNRCYTDFGLLYNGDVNHAENIFLPASTGIAGKNSEGASAVMDLLAVTKSSNSDIQIEPLYGIRQRSPYRYGSAFSRAMRISEPDQKWIFVSGTASINEDGKTIHIGDFSAQVEHTVEVINSLIQPEGVSFSDFCEATVFLKRKEDFSRYQEIAESLGISNIPAVYLVADVCWNELLFELDASFTVSIPHNR